MTQPQIDKLNDIFQHISKLDDKILDILGYDHPLYDSIGVQLAEIYSDLVDHFNYDPNGPE